MNKRQLLLVLLTMSIFCADWQAAASGNPQSIYPDRALVLYPGSSDVLWDLRPESDPDSADYIVIPWDFGFDFEQQAEIVLEWVAAGRGMILHTVLASWHFPQLFDDYIFDDSVWQDAAYTLVASDIQHPVLECVKVVMPSRGLSRYMAKKQANPVDMESIERLDPVPLLVDKSGNVLAAAFRYGLGRVVLVGTADFDGSDPISNAFPDGWESERFRRNLRCWLATGRSVAAPCSSSGPRDALHLTSGDTVY